MNLKKSAIPLFDDRGFRVTAGLQSKTCKPDIATTRYDRFSHDMPGYEESLGRLRVTEMVPPGFSAAMLWARAQALKDELAADRQIAGILNNICLPVFIPSVRFDDQGSFFDTIMLSHVKSAYKEQFPGREFISHCQGRLAGQVKQINVDRQPAQTTTRPEGLVALFFPEALRGFSVNAQVEQMAALPQNRFVLSGPIVMSMVFIMHPKELARDMYVPGLVAASARYGTNVICFRAYNDSLQVGTRNHLDEAFDSSSGGLFYAEENPDSGRRVECIPSLSLHRPLPSNR